MKNEWIPNPIRRAVAIKSAGKCYHCGKQAAKAIKDRWSILRFYDEAGIPFEIDHIVARMDGGKTTIDNLVLACRSCNRGRKRVTASQQEEIDSLMNTINNPSKSND